MNILQICHKPPLPALDGGCKAMHALTEGFLANGISVKMKSYSDVVGLVTTCDYTGSWISADYPEDY